ncbi:MAG TPA: YitT family protein [Herpetosiphonaceae bacterium]
MKYLPTIARVLRDYLIMTIGVICIAISVDLFLVPNNVVTGGITGVAIILNDLVGLPVGLLSLLFNIPLLIAGFRYLGGFVFGIRTVYATVALALAIDLLAPYVGRYMHATRDPLLYTLYGGVLDGVGIGLVFRVRGTTGGTDIIARFVQRWKAVPMGRSLLVMNVIVFAAAAYLFSLDKLLYALLVAFISGRTVDLVLEGASYARQAVIITEHPARIQAAILSSLGRGVTVLEGRGGYTASERTVLLSVVAQSEVSMVKAIVRSCDADAFVIFSNVNEVLGEGFRPAIE